MNHEFIMHNVKISPCPPTFFQMAKQASGSMGHMCQPQWIKTYINVYIYNIYENTEWV